MKKIFIPLLAIAAIAGSCKKQLEVRPTDAIDIVKAFQNVNDLERGLLNVYSFNSITNRIYIAGLLSDELKISNENRGQGQFTFKYQFSAGDGEHNSDYAVYAFMTDRANRILSIIDGVPATTQADIDKKARIKAEVTTLRGIAMYERLIRFMPAGYDANALGIPVITRVLAIEAPARNTVGETMNQIVADLAVGRAEPGIPNAYTDVVRLSKAAIAGYQARAALLRKDYTNAITFATDAITLSGKTLATGTTYVDYWKDANESETIWKYKNNTTPQLLFRDANGDVFFEPSDKLKSQYNKTADIRYSTFFGSVTTGGQNDTSIVKKYPGSGTGPQINDLKLMRLSEMYLLRAEAYAESNQLTQATADLNAIRTARGAATTTPSSQAQAVAEIINERYKELAFEGFRFFDLKRKGLPVTRNASDVQSSNWQNIAAGDYHFALPIPQSEIQANPNAVQNPGYN